LASEHKSEPQAHATHPTSRLKGRRVLKCALILSFAFLNGQVLVPFLGAIFCRGFH
jgi:hypothetical protein